MPAWLLEFLLKALLYFVEKEAVSEHPLIKPTGSLKPDLNPPLSYRNTPNHYDG